MGASASEEGAADESFEDVGSPVAEDEAGAPAGGLVLGAGTPPLIDLLQEAVRCF